VASVLREVLTQFRRLHRSIATNESIGHRTASTLQREVCNTGEHMHGVRKPAQVRFIQLDVVSTHSSRALAQSVPQKRFRILVAVHQPTQIHLAIFLTFSEDQPSLQ
jgi:hypothetical protein